MVDLLGDIRPGEGAAGLRLGRSFSEIDFGPAQIVSWTRDQGPLAASIAATSGWLRVNLEMVSFAQSGTYELNYHHGAIVLQFSKAHILYNISVYSDYRGALAGTIRIGDRLATVLKLIPLFYDSGDEMHYPGEGSPIHGIGFIAEPLPLEERPDQVIIGMYVHDWNLRGD